MDEKFEAARQYLHFALNREEYQKTVGEDIRYLSLDRMVVVSAEEVIEAISKLLEGKITAQELVDWVNIVWSSDAYEFAEDQTDSIVSVMDQLECLDEEGVSFTEARYIQMMECLRETGNFRVSLRRIV